jgi:hypothetical protein
MNVRGCYALAVGMLLLTSVGCTQRRVTIRSNPPGALVFIDDYEIGTTPVSTDFTYYGTRKIRLVKDGYETLTINQPIYPPWFQILPFEFFADNLVPGEIRDERVVDLQLTPQVLVAQQQLRARAEGLRQSTQISVPVVPPAPNYGSVPVPTYNSGPLPGIGSSMPANSEPIFAPPPVNVAPSPIITAPPVGLTPYP